MELSEEAIKKLQGFYKAKFGKDFTEKEIIELAGQTDKVYKDDVLDKIHFSDGFEFEKKVENYFTENGWTVDANVNCEGTEIDLIATKENQVSMTLGLNLNPESSLFNIKLIINCKGITLPTSIYFEKKKPEKIESLISEQLYFYKTIKELREGRVFDFHHYQTIGEDIAYKDINSAKKNEILNDFKQCLEYQNKIREKDGVKIKKEDIFYNVVFINPLAKIATKEGEEWVDITDNFQFAYKYDNEKYAVADIVLFDKKDEFLKAIESDIEQFKGALRAILTQRRINQSRQSRGRTHYN